VSVGELTRDIFQQLSDALVSAELRVHDDEPDSIHSMRTIVRRIRSLLSSLRPMFEPGSTDELRERLTQLGAVLGKARDLEVSAATAEDALADIPLRFGSAEVRARLIDDVRLEFAIESGQVRTYLHDRAYAVLAEELESFVEAPPLDMSQTTDDPSQFDAAARMDAIVRKQVHRTVKRWKRAREKSEFPLLLEDLHDVRKAAKRLRYTAEALDASGLLETSYAPIGEAAEQIQDRLGSHRDMLLYAEQLVNQAERAHEAGESTFVYGVMHQRLETDASDRLSSVSHAVHALRRAKKAL
jgi:CHAD domain-containing protein